MLKILRKYFFLPALFLSSSCLHAQRISAEEYIEQYKDIAVSEMIRSGVPAAVTLAQGLLETECGNSELVKKSNNHFGIKCKSTWTGASVTHDDDASGECFRAYETPAESFRDHSDFLRGNARYGSLFRLDIKDYRGWAYGLKAAGYATNPNYPAILIKNIEQYNLQQYTLYALARLSNPDSAQYPVDSTIEAVNQIKPPGEMNGDSAGLKDPYPRDKVFTINKCRCVYAQKGTALADIARNNNIPLNKLLEYNELEKEARLDKDQLIYLQRKSMTGETDLYEVKAEENAYEVAQKNGIQLSALLEYNRINKYAHIFEGLVLALKPGVNPVSLRPAVAETPKVHIVSAKEGLYSIAKKYGVTVKQLKEWNNLNSDYLKIGQQLIVSHQ